MAKSKYNVSFFLPILDLVVFVLLFVGAAKYWYDTRGQEQIVESAAIVEEARKENIKAVEDRREAIEFARAAKQDVIFDKEAKIKQAEMIDQQIKVEHERIQAGDRRTRELTDLFSQTRGEINRTDEQRRTKMQEILERREEIAQFESDVAELRAQVDDSLSVRSRIQEQIAALHRERQRDPLSIFPPGAAVASLVEIENDDQFFMISLSGVVKEFGNINVGLTGNLGLANNTENSIKEGGVFLNIPLAFRRASLDLESGLGSMRGSSGKDDVTGYVGATLRYAPFYKERFFLLAGTKYRESDANVRVGIGFGRR